MQLTREEIKKEIEMNKSRGFFCQRNYEYETHKQDEDGKVVPLENSPTESEWKELVLKELFEIEPNYSFIAFIFHDRDIDKKDKNNPKKVGLHCHFVIKYEELQNYDEIYLQTKCNRRNFRRLISQIGALKYLTHITDKAIKDGKTEYNINELYVIDKTSNKPNQFLLGEELENWYKNQIEQDSDLKNKKESSK
jgi:plasmid replication protein